MVREVVPGRFARCPRGAGGTRPPCCLPCVGRSDPRRSPEAVSPGAAAPEGAAPGGSRPTGAGAPGRRGSVSNGPAGSVYKQRRPLPIRERARATRGRGTGTSALAGPRRRGDRSPPGSAPAVAVKPVDLPRRRPPARSCFFEIDPDQYPAGPRARRPPTPAFRKDRRGGRSKPNSRNNSRRWITRLVRR